MLALHVDHYIHISYESMSAFIVLKKKMKIRASWIAMYITVYPPSYLDLPPFELLYFIIIYNNIIILCTAAAGPDRRAHTCLLRRVAQLHCRLYTYNIATRIYYNVYYHYYIVCIGVCSHCWGTSNWPNCPHPFPLLLLLFVFFRAALLLGGRHAPPTLRASSPRRQQ